MPFVYSVTFCWPCSGAVAEQFSKRTYCLAHPLLNKHVLCGLLGLRGLLVLGLDLPHILATRSRQFALNWYFVNIKAQALRTASR